VILVFGLLQKKHSQFEKIIEEKRKLEEELFSYKLREREIELQEDKLRFGLGIYLDEYVFKMKEYLRRRQDVNLTLISAVEPTDELSDECFAGFWYGVKVMDGDTEILRIKTFLIGDGCFISEFAAKRRKSHLLLGTLLCQYLKYCIESDRELTNCVKSIEIKEEINVNKALFNDSVEKDS
jgi:hypothetical protein